MRPRGGLRHVLLRRRNPISRVWRRRVGIRPGSDSVVIGGVRAAMGSRRRRVLRRGGVEPGILIMRASLILRRNRSLGRQERLGHHVAPRDISINGGKVVKRLLGSSNSLCTPRLPVGEPRCEAVLLVMDALMELPLKSEEPLQFHGVQFANRYVADLGP